MSDRRSLPRRPDLRRLRDEAKARQRAGEFPTLALAQLAIAREHGFASWPRLKLAVDALALDATERAAELVRSACSSDVRRARVVLDADPALARHDLACACVTGEAGAVERRIGGAPELVRAKLPPFGWEPLLYACFSRLLRAEPSRAAGIREAVRLLLAAGADPNASFDHDGWKQVPLYGAAGIANDAVVTRMLIDAGADPNDAAEPDGVGEALYHAVEFPDPTCAALLIEAGTHPHVVDYCLGRALNFPAPAMVEMICAHGARASGDQLHQAVLRRRGVDTVRILLDAGAPLDERDEHGLTPAQVAAGWGDDEVVALLIGRGADATALETSGKAIGADMLIVATQAGDLDAVRRLLDRGEAVDGVRPEIGRPLGQAAWRGHPTIVRELVERGARLSWNEGSAIGAALHGSRHCHHPEGGPTMRTVEEIPRDRYGQVARILLDAGAPVPERVGDEPLGVAALLADLGIELDLQE
jgi:ankyrin repeat protein